MRATPAFPAPVTAPDPTSAPRTGPGRGVFVFALIVLAALAFAGWRGWQAWSAREAAMRHAFAEQADALDARLDALRGEQRAQSLRMQQDETTNRVLREELIGLGQRSALIEQTVEKAGRTDRHGAQALLLDETALLLAIGQQRLQLAGDADATRRAYALSREPARARGRSAAARPGPGAGAERAALDALGPDHARPRCADSRRSPPPCPPVMRWRPATHAPWWSKLLSRVVRVQPAAAPSPPIRANAPMRVPDSNSKSPLRAAAERRDTVAWREALDRAGAWLR